VVERSGLRISARYQGPSRQADYSGSGIEGSAGRGDTGSKSRRPTPELSLDSGFLPVKSVPPECHHLESSFSTLISCLASRWRQGGLLAALVCACCALPALQATAAPTGSIAGTVIAADTHLGLQGVDVCASRYVEIEEGEGERVEKCNETDAAGAYSIEALEEGEYDVEFGPGELPYFGQFREESVLVDGGPTIGIDAELAPAAMIAGMVSAGGQSVGEEKVCAWRLPAAEKGRCAWTEDDGRYAIRFETPGEFRVEFQAVGNFATQYYDHKRHAPEADAVTATLGTVRSGVDASLEAGGRVQGTVRASSGPPLQEILVCAVEATSLEPEACDETGVFGQYSVGPLATGAYKIGFSVELGREFFGEALFLGENDGFQTRFYDEQTTIAAANTINLLAPSSVSGVDAQIVPSEPSTAVPPPTVTLLQPPNPHPKRLHCRHGFKKKRVHGKQRCVRVHKRRR
jgi:hypothetical protein